jgi:DNA invertase Pin-like site-specific DNA recombinase
LRSCKPIDEEVTNIDLRDLPLRTKRAALYLQVSMDGQAVGSQRLALASICEQRGWQTVSEYADNDTKGHRQRPGFDALLKDATRGRFDVVLAWAFDSLGCSLMDLLDTLSKLDAVGVALVLHQQAIDTTTPAGRMFVQVTDAFAEFERAMIRSRAKAGLERAKARGVRLGRPKTSAKVEAAICARLAAGVGVNKVAKMVGVGNGTVQRIKAEMMA